ncbi:actin-binding WH2 domain-containing protein [Capilliphycus salinus ALCB114379]|uniref:actin-binding WH2 domain-containing protein n=1 Tax=Capilliphycus salinus TaxID=2768948 RepID=UPI0039A4EE3E
MNSFATVMNLLRERQQFLEDIRLGVKLKPKLVNLFISSSVFFGIYGLIIGSSSSFLQAVFSGIKLPALYLLTLIICFPTLYFFNVMFGSKQSFEQYLTLLLAAMAEISVLLLGFAPVTFFFMLSTQDYQFFKILNVGIFALTGFLGVKFFYDGMQFMCEKDEEGQKLRLSILRFWLILYAFVGSQLGWTLRPFFGAPGEPFQLFREQDSNFYLNVIESLNQLFQ